YTVLMAASEMGHAKIVELLLKKGADKTLKDEDGSLATDYAKAEEHKKVEALLR
ncbi:ankyrin repeat domain-containing protein, partial [Sulfurimonas sp. MAG313]|nr:ankyrin repeat domain-containing protein [Sulfurimonas sp. MAG313]